MSEMIDLQLVCCPRCRGALGSDRVAKGLACTQCARTYPVVDDVPVLLEHPVTATTVHQGSLPERPEYAAWKERLILKSLTDAQIALDFGAGRQALDDPCILKLDVVFDPTLDVVGDLHQLPIPSDSVDFAFGGAVMEHRASWALRSVLGTYIEHFHPVTRMEKEFLWLLHRSPCFHPGEPDSLGPVSCLPLCLPTLVASA